MGRVECQNEKAFKLKWGIVWEMKRKELAALS
jgi:hypothetical protein